MNHSMTPAQFRESLDRLGLPHVRIAELLGVESRTIRYWLAGERDIPQLVIRVLRAAERGTLRLEDLVT